MRLFIPPKGSTPERPRNNPPRGIGTLEEQYYDEQLKNRSLMLPNFGPNIDRWMPQYLPDGTKVPYDDPRYGPQIRPVRVEPKLELTGTDDRLTPADPLGVGVDRPSLYDIPPLQPGHPLYHPPYNPNQPVTPADPLGVGKGTYDPLATPLPSSPTQLQEPITLGGPNMGRPRDPSTPYLTNQDDPRIAPRPAPTQQPTPSPQPDPTQPPQVYDPLATPLPTQQYAGGAVVRQMAGGGSTYTSEPPMSGLSSILAMQGRLGDSTLVHMNPMEVEMLKTMSPDGNLSYNPETGLPEAFKLKDIAAFALPIAAGIAAPYLLPAMGITGVGGVTAGAIGAGVGGFGSGLIQGKGVGNSLVQGGLSGLMSYGMGSMMAPSTVTGGAGPIQGGTTSTPIADITGATASMDAGAGMMAPSNTVLNMPGGLPVAGAADSASIATLNQSIGPPAGTPTSSFADIGFGPKDSVQYTAATDVYAPGTSETGIGQMFDRAGRTSPFGSTAFDGSQLGPTQVPTYTQIGGSALGSAGQMYMDSMLSPEEMPYDIADDEAYYDADLEGGRLRGRANARTLRRPFESIDPSEYYRMATSPGGIGTFYAAEGGSVSRPYGDTYGDPYGPGDAYGGVADASNTSGTPGSESTSGSGLGSLGDSIDMGLGVANPSPIGIAASLAGLALGIPGLGPAVAIGRGIAGLMGPANVNAIGQSQVSGVGNQSVDAYGNPVGSMENIASEMNMGNKGFDAADDVEGMMSDAVQGFADAHEGEVGDAGAAAAANADAAASAAATADAMGFAQGGIASLAYGGNPPTGYANQAFEGTVPGVGTGMSDDVPFSIEGDQPALLSRDEYVLPADVVSQLGDGSSGAGSDMLDNFISQVRQTKYGNTQQPPPVGRELMIELMRSGGIV